MPEMPALRISPEDYEATLNGLLRGLVLLHFSGAMDWHAEGSERSGREMDPTYRRVAMVDAVRFVAKWCLPAHIGADVLHREDAFVDTMLEALEPQIAH
jgi:hypothetical protein